VRALILAFVWALAGSLPQQGPPRDAPARRDAPPNPTGAISGRVSAAATGAPIQGAIVTLAVAVELDRDAPAVSQLPFRPGRADRGPTTVTDAFGRFRIDSVPAGTYRLVVTPGGYRGRYLPMGFGAVRANDAGRPISIRAGEEIRDADVGLTTGVAIEGRVVDETGEALSRIPVFAARLFAGSESAQRVSDLSVITDDLGRYRIYGLEPGTYVVGADGHVLPVMVFDGTVRSFSSGHPESDPFVTTYYPSATTDAAAQPVRVGGQDVGGIDIVLRRAQRFAVSGTILDSQGAPASTRVVLVRGGLTSVPNIGFTSVPAIPFTSDSSGRFRFPAALEAGTYRLLVGSGLWPGLTSVNGRTEFADLPVTVGAGPIDLSVVTQPGIGLAGRVVFGEGPPASPLSIRIAFRRPDKGAATLEVPATMGDDWRFFGSDLFGPFLVRVSSLPSGWVVKAVTLSGADITDVPTAFTRQDNDRLEIVLSSKASTVEGEVKGEEPGRPIDATVYVFSQDRASWSSTSPRTIRSDVPANGRFSVTGLAAGRYYAIAIAREGFRPPQQAGEPFFDLLSKTATPFVIGDDERRTVDLTLWRWPE
jgi:hypothetical protein